MPIPSQFQSPVIGLLGSQHLVAPDECQLQLWWSYQQGKSQNVVQCIKAQRGMGRKYYSAEKEKPWHGAWWCPISIRTLLPEVSAGADYFE